VRRPARHEVRRPRVVWPIIYIDLITQVMVFFVILWSMERSEAESAQLGTGVGIGDQSVRMVDLPGDVLFGSGRAELGAEGREVFARLFGDPQSGVLDFDLGGTARRTLAIHGHTDEVGPKDDNFLLGYQRAWAVYQEIRKHGAELPDHVVICTHADNTPARLVPPLRGDALSDEERAAIEKARALNRRITIEDLITSPPGEE
jgi:flagellar motor protein MotB